MVGAPLGAFQVLHPEFAVRLDTSTTLVDFDNDNIDVGIRGGMGNYPGLVSHLLLRAEYTPMLSPALAASIGGVKTPADLLKLPLSTTVTPGTPNGSSSPDYPD